MTDSSTQAIRIVLHPVSDPATAKAVYAALLGVPPQTDEPYYVGFEAAGQHIGLMGGEAQGTTSPVAYWHVPDLEAKLAKVTATGATVKEPAHDVGGGHLVATVTDPDGNVLGLLQDRLAPTPAPVLSVVATPSVGSPTTSTAGWPAPRRTARRTWCRFPSTGTARRCWWPHRRTARPAGTSPPPAPFGWGWVTPATCP